MPTPVVAHSLQGTTAIELGAGTARWRADLDASIGGAGNDPTPHELLDSALAACTVLTLQLYARRKQIPLTGAQAQVERQEGGGVYRMVRQLTLEGDLSETQRTDLLRVANACPIHKALQNRFEIDTRLS
jgi:putative redox protein